MADQVAGAAVFVGGDQGVDDHHAGRGGDGDVHRRLADGSSAPWLAHEHAVQQRHDDEAAAEAKQHGGDAGHTAEECQQVGRTWRVPLMERSTIERRGLACFSKSANNVCVYANCGKRSMRNVSINLLDDTPRPVVAIGTDYSHGHLLPFHTHRRAQLLYGATGVMQVRTHDGNWVVPPQRAVWIPPGVAHEVLMLGEHAQCVHRAGAVDLGSAVR
jgi:mannose-6-phosphate isomerase-like protein (cupin superfamily)